MTAIPTAELPPVVSAYLERSQGSEPGTALGLFAANATVTDSGTNYSGQAQVKDFLERATTEFTYTSTVISAEQDGHVATATNRLEGNFPGGVVELRYQFALNDNESSIDQLAIS